MSSGPTLDQLRVLAAIADAGSYSAAARRLERSQPVVSYMMATLGFALFERTKRKPVLTERGAAMLTHARRLCLLSDTLSASVDNLRQGLESELSLGVDLFFPPDRLALALRDLAARYPSVTVTVRSEPMGGLLDLVLQRQCLLGISVLTMDWPDEIEPCEFGEVEFLPVAAPGHALAQCAAPPTSAQLREHVQVLLRDPGSQTRPVDNAIAGLNTWRVTDLELKLCLLRKGVAWGHMPRHLVQDDLDQHRLVRLQLPARQGKRTCFTLLHCVDRPPGPAGRWLMQRLKAWD